MRQFLFVVIAAVALFATVEAKAVCQDCPGNGTVNAQCVVVGQCDRAIYAACYERQNFDANGQLVSEQCVGSAAGSDCNKPASYCGGGGDPGGGGGGGGGGGCSLGPTGCPSYCSSCEMNDW